MEGARAPRRYRFAGFVLSPARRALFRQGREVPLIGRYLDLLLLLVERHPDAVTRHDILDAVWSDVVVSDGALNQAVRTLRRALGDDPRQPTFIRTVARYGYRFVCPDVAEEEEDALVDAPDASALPEQTPASRDDPVGAPLRRLLEERPDLDRETDDAERIEAAERLHELGTAEVLRRLGSGGDVAAARAFLREARWDVPGAGPVPLLGRPGALRAARTLVRLRLRRLLRVAGARWAGAVLGGGLAGLVAGCLGGLVLLHGPGSRADSSTPLLLGLVGLVIGALGAAGAGGGLAVAEAVARSYRGTALVGLGAAGGGTVGALAHLVGQLALAGLFGRDLSAVAGGREGLVLGGALGLGYHLATRSVGEGLAAPRGRRRLAAAAVTGLCTALAGAALVQSGSYLGAMSLDLLARSFPGSQVSMGPLARLLGEARPGPLTATLVSAWEGLCFGFGTAAGLTRRPRGEREALPEPALGD